MCRGTADSMLHGKVHRLGITQTWVWILILHHYFSFLSFRFFSSKMKVIACILQGWLLWEIKDEICWERKKANFSLKPTQSRSAINRSIVTLLLWKVPATELLKNYSFQSDWFESTDTKRQLARTGIFKSLSLFSVYLPYR